MQEKTTNTTFESLDQNKLQRMLQIKQQYDKGLLSLDKAKSRMKSEVGRISPEEFAAAEQMFKNEDPDECRNEDVRTILEVFDGLIQTQEPGLPYGHSIDAYRRENDKMKQLLLKGDELARRPFVLNPWLELMEQIIQYKVHFSRKQNQLYSALERKGFDRPSTTMWMYDDEIRDEMNNALELLSNGNVNTDSFLDAYRQMTVDLRDLMEKEELILYPTSLKLIPENEFEEMKSGDREIGFFLIDMPDLHPSSSDKEVTPVAGQNGFMDDLAALLARYGKNIETGPQEKVLDVAEGKLTLEQINLLFRHLPVDISFVDENDLVKFYTDTPHRVFPRSKGVIGREVRNCHPPKSLHMVEEIIEKFRSGEQSKSEFWINKPGLFIYIVYVAVRDKDGTFRGVMEMMQDCTHIRQLEGERRLLTWEEEQNQLNGGKEVKESAGDEENGKEGYEGNGDNAIVITADTKLKTLIQRYPRLKADLPGINPKFSMLQSPMARVVLPIATLKMMSEQSGMPQQELIEKINDLIATY
ncbi:PAS domain-containing protein [uncultured Proteiniphilum sp.]|uniref:PAS domain-containing protein n=1 Tax=uncultured Proteiniphilum sp. TaxID=497637 RepID=UPI00263625FA|nr:PAS domain-containing protein [uncultured Proteiniphilum sp.]